MIHWIWILSGIDALLALFLIRGQTELELNPAARFLMDIDNTFTLFIAAKWYGTWFVCFVLQKCEFKHKKWVERGVVGFLICLLLWQIL